MRKISYFFAISIFVLILTSIALKKYNQQNNDFTNRENQLKSELINLEQQLSDFQKIDQVADTLQLTILSYQDLVDLKGDKKQFVLFDKLFVQTLSFLQNENYASASATLQSLNTELKKATEVKVVANVPVAGSPATAGTQIVTINSGDFTVRLISADLKSKKVVVETASDKDCTDNCPVASLSTLASRAGAFAAINGPYFCPATYPACANKKNSFDTLMMNRQKVYFNSDNNVYSNVPVAVFSTTSRFMTQSSQWGRVIRASMPSLPDNPC